MKKLLAILSILLIPAVASADPFLGGDPNLINADKSQVEFDGTWEPAVIVAGCTQKQVGCVWTDANNVQHYLFRDLAGITDGAHTARARFISNVWGESEPSDPFDFTKSRPAKPGIRLIP
jgi:hypothetical protein